MSSPNRPGGKGAGAGARRSLLGALVAAAGLAATGCGAGGGVATPAGTAASQGTASSSAQGSGTQTSGIRTVLSPIGLRLHSQASKDSPVVGSAAQGTVLQVIGFDGSGGGWYQVKGQTTSGYVSADPALSSSRRFQLYSSTAKGLTALYPEGWTFSESTGGVLFRPGGGDQWIFVHFAPTPDGLGAPGLPGYSVSRTGTVEINGITGVLRDFDRGTASPPPGPGGTKALAHLEEVGVEAFGGRAVRADFGYDSQDQLQDFTDFYNSMQPVGSPTPAPPVPAPPPAALTP